MSDTNQRSKPARIAYAGGNDDFRKARADCAAACRAYNEIPEDAPAEVRVAKFLAIVNPGFQITGEVTTAEAMYRAGAAAPRPLAPFVKTPIRMDYGRRVKISTTTFINYGCAILDTPVADVTVGENCMFGPNVTLASVGHPLRAEHRMATAADGTAQSLTSYGVAITVGDNVWIGAGAIILGGVTIGDRCVIGAGSVITRGIPADSLAVGNPAKVIRSIADEPLPQYGGQAMTFEEALRINTQDK